MRSFIQYMLNEKFVCDRKGSRRQMKSSEHLYSNVAIQRDETSDDEYQTALRMSITAPLQFQ